MAFSATEKLILTMLCDIAEKVNADEIDPGLVREAIATDNHWAIAWQYPGIFGDTETLPTPIEVKETCDFLDMWNAIERSYAEYDDAQKATVEQIAGALGKEPKFKGFDGNNETEYFSAIDFLVNGLNRYEEFDGRDFNSHMPSVERYRAMRQAFDEHLEATGHKYELPPETLANILIAHQK